MKLNPVDELDLMFRRYGFPKAEREVRVSPDRRFRFDLAWPSLSLACEFEGGVWTKGRHTRGSGFENDCTKYSLASLFGWRVIRVTVTMLRDGRAQDLIELAAACVLPSRELAPAVVAAEEGA